jgi:hypothetical protein
MTRRTLALGLLLLAGSAGSAHAQATLQTIGHGLGVTDLSYDGSVAVGNTVGDGAYETWRWVDGDPNGWQRLGSPTVPYIGAGAGSPDVSYDGTRVSATIITEDLTYATQGIWTEGVGWTELIPPMAADGTIRDNYYGSAWGLSGDGVTLSGMYQTNSPFYGVVRPCFSTIGGGAPVALPSPTGHNARPNAVNFDGTIAVGWSEDPYGPWMGTVWRDGTYTVISPDRGPGNNVGGPAEAVNADGSVIVGQVYNEQAARFNAARWDWNGTSYDLTDLGVLPNTPQTYVARVWATSVSDDGSVIAGVNRFRDNGPASIVTGFVWTAQDGMRDIVDVMADYGISLPENQYVVSLVVSPDGHAFGLMANDPSVGLDYWSYLFRITPPPSCVGDFDGNGSTDVLDFATFAANFGATGLIPYTNGDLDGDGDVDIFDFAAFAGGFGCSVAS